VISFITSSSAATLACVGLWLCAGLRALLIVAAVCFGLLEGSNLRAGELSRAELAAKFSPPFSLGERDAVLPVYPVFRNEGGGDKLAAYVFESADLAPIPGFSGTPPNLLIILGSDGAFQRVAVISQHEPVFVDGLGREPLDHFVEQYAGKTLIQNVKVGPPRGAGAVREGANYIIDGVAKATASVRIINESVLAAALAVARAKLGVSGPAKIAASVKPEFQPMDFTDMENAGLVTGRLLKERDVEAAFAGTAGEGADAIAGRSPDAVFAELRVAYLNIPSVGENLLGKAQWERVREQLDGGHAIIVWVGGRYRPFDEPYVPGATPDMFSLMQHGLALDIKDYVYGKPLALADTPKAPFAIFKVFGRAGFDPASPWQLNLRVTREKGQIWPERISHNFQIEVRLPQRWFNLPNSDTPSTGWQGAWRDRARDLAILGVALGLLGVVLTLQPASMRRPRLVQQFRLAYLVFTLVVVGWTFQAQLSIVTLAGLVKAVFVTHDLGFLLWDPPSLVLWAVVLVTAVIWGRGTFCGWLCPFGALQELLAATFCWARIPQWQLDPRLDSRLRGLKYFVLAGFLAIATLWQAKAETAAEIEPFKTAITMMFQRSLSALAWVAILLVANLFLYRAFCRFLCPLGAFVAVLGRGRQFDWIARRRECGSRCRICERRCRYGAIGRSGAIDYNECFQCMDCVVFHEDRRVCFPLRLADRKAGREPCEARKAAEAAQ
jgi:transcriptional regulator of nitric oxide reductase